MVDIIIIGQGIAGSLLTCFLHQKGLRVLLLDNGKQQNATRVASGITNPVTGRRMVKTWLADELLPFAEKTYRSLEDLWQVSMYKPLQIIRLFDSVKMQNDWAARTAESAYASYLQNQSLINPDKNLIQNEFGAFEISGGSKLDTTVFLNSITDFLRSEKLLVNEQFSFADLKELSDSITYKGIAAKKIVFCEGYGALQNPYFRFLPFQPAKGECLMIETERPLPYEMISSEAFVAHMSDHTYYVGSTHEWNFTDDQPSVYGKTELLANLHAFLKCPYRIISHQAAVRPTVKDRRPFIGFHPEHSAIGIFNGLGTKGISLAPYFAQNLANHIISGTPLLKEADIARFS